MADPVGMVFKRDREGFLDYFADWPAKELLDYRTVNGDSAIHIAAAMEDPQLIKKFLERLTLETGVEALKQTDAFGNNGLHEAAVVENYDRAAALGKTKLLQILTEQVGVLRCHFRRDYDDNTILHMAVLGQHFETAIWLLDRDSSLADKRATLKSDELSSTSRKPPKSDEHIGFTCLELLALMPTAFTVILSCLRTYLDDDCNYKEDLETDKIDNRMGHAKKRRGSRIMKKIWKKMKMREHALALVKMLVKLELEKKAETREQEISTSSTNPTTISLGLGKGDDLVGKKLVDYSAKELVEALTIKDHTDKAVYDHRKAPATDRTLLFAASNGIRDILEEILRQNPQAMLSTVNQKGQTILHVAVRRRRHDIFQFIVEKMPLYVPKWAARIDENGYTILHHVADMKHYEYGIRPGPVYQFQEELQWFECVKDIAPSHYTMHRDTRKNMTAGDLFNRTHEDQLKKAQDWIKETSESCSILSILIATFVFAAAYTVPGGNNDKGFPNFLDSPMFYLFTITDVASLSLSLSSAVMFLSILTSPRESSDFLDHLPRKLKIGFMLLFLSVLASMITFSASILLVARLGERWTVALYAAAILPVILLALIALPLYGNFEKGLNHYLGLSKERKKNVN
ncbi:PGG domain-containing protein [Citrus sinensis]|uniref:PGG domain-containing protein n=1 Tax=Citrus sinensis TaxID=2711 RepID=A0ACB8NZ47_CITSI|nr:PGG domain-containing protein [Citrus sinensis]